MSLEGLILFLLIGLIAGWLAGRIMRGGGFGLAGDLIVGVIGALLGGWLFGLLGLSAGGFLGQLIVALVGAIILLYLLRLIKRAYLGRHREQAGGLWRRSRRSRRRAVDCRESKPDSGDGDRRSDSCSLSTASGSREKTVLSGWAAAMRLTMWISVPMARTEPAGARSTSSRMRSVEPT